MEVTRIFKMNLDDFNKMMTENNYQVVVKEVKDEGAKKFRYKTGIKTKITYRDENINGKNIPNYYADISKEDVFSEKTVILKSVYFTFLNLIDQKQYEMMNYDKSKELINESNS